jgi:cytochrome c biogenesis protein CcmG/thiol:disulfide interchange protein DsbE
LSNSTRNRVAGVLIAGLMALSPLLAADTDQLDLDQYHGKIVVLDFWASWCVPCRRSFPWMNSMQEKYGDDGLVIIAVNVDNEAADAAAFLQEYPAKFEIVYDNDRQLVRDYAIEAMPSSFLIGRDGNVIGNHLGFKTAKTEEYEAAIVAALGE